MEKQFILHGVVQKGHHRGKRLGFPTMNVSLNKPVSEGIYVSQTDIKGKQYNGLTFIGAAKTFGETDVNAETYLFDFHQDVYGEMVTVTLLKKLRENKTFDSEEALITQMEEDKKQAKAFFSTFSE